MLIKVEALSREEQRARGVDTWPARRHERHRIPVQYQEETVCFVAEGSARIETEDGNVEIEPGDLVTFPEGLDCTWHLREPLQMREQPHGSG
jgi:uncharacterized cupin superfamily protein